MRALGYFAGTDPDDPLIAPVKHADVLSRFPPTLLINGTRDFALSNTLHTNVELAKIGVETRLYVWDGLFHGFFYNPSVPESQDAYRIIVRFFDQHLAGAH
jgi:acetyl esterase/lipase